VKIIKFTAENVKRLKAVEITPSGALVQVTGRNGQGKTSVLDSIWWALAGKEGIQKVPIRRGADKGRIELDLGDYIVERRFTPSGSTIHVRNRDGATYGSPQTMLDGLIGELSFDPLAFSRMETRRQFDELRRIAKVELDTEELDRLNRSDYATRTEINRQAKSARARAAAIVVPAAPEVAGVDEAEILNRMQAAADHNADIERRRSKVVRLREVENGHRRDAERLRSEATRLRAQADNLDAQALGRESEADAAKASAESESAIPQAINIAELRSQLNRAKEYSAALSRHLALADQLKAATADAESLEERARELTERIAKREETKLAAISAAQMPVDGLGFGDGEVTLNGLPFEQASDAEKLRVSLAIAMASNPKLRVIRIRDGSLLDEDALRTIGAIAKDQDYQIWLERVDGSGQVGVVMEDGLVVADHQIDPQEVSA